ncbi:MAG: hypothetical protein GY926_21265 [bacterium]|nr:hypothetical protein [bacterium]
MRLYVGSVEATDDFAAFDCCDDDLNAFVHQYANTLCGDGYPKAIKAVERASGIIAGLLFLNSVTPVDGTGAVVPVELGKTLILDAIMVDRRYQNRHIENRLFDDTLKLFSWLGLHKGFQLLAVHAQDEWLRDRLAIEGLRQSNLFSRSAFTLSIFNARASVPDFLPPASIDPEG